MSKLTISNLILYEVWVTLNSNSRYYIRKLFFSFKKFEKVSRSQKSNASVLFDTSVAKKYLKYLVSKIKCVDR